MRKPQFANGGVEHATINGHRFHLRMTDPWELNPLWIDGRHLLLLDQVAGETVSAIIEGIWKFQSEFYISNKVKEFVVNKLYRRYGRPFALKNRVTKETIAQNVDRIYGTLIGIATGDSCPVKAGLPLRETEINKWAAPARMDLAVTYECNEDCPHCYLRDDQKKTLPLLSSDWFKILKYLWTIGIPHIVFTGGEPTMFPDIIELISEAEEFVTGLITNGTMLNALAQPLRNASLDYVQVTLESHIPEIHNAMTRPKGFDGFALTLRGIKKALEVGGPEWVVTNTTLTKENAPTFPALLEYGAGIGLRNMSCNALICSGRGTSAKKINGLSAESLKTILTESIEVAKRLGINLQWYSPTCYKELNPLELGFGAKTCSAAAYNMTVQPDGTVLPCQSWSEPVGNILFKDKGDSWTKIWEHPTCVKLREHKFAKSKCSGCEYEAVCGGGCPLETA